MKSSATETDGFDPVRDAWPYVPYCLCAGSKTKGSRMSQDISALRVAVAHLKTDGHSAEADTLDAFVNRLLRAEEERDELRKALGMIADEPPNGGLTPNFREFARAALAISEETKEAEES